MACVRFVINTRTDDGHATPVGHTTHPKKGLNHIKNRYNTCN